MYNNEFKQLVFGLNSRETNDCFTGEPMSTRKTQSPPRPSDAVERVTIREHLEDAITSLRDGDIIPYAAIYQIERAAEVLKGVLAEMRVTEEELREWKAKLNALHKKMGIEPLP